MEKIKEKIKKINETLKKSIVFKCAGLALLLNILLEILGRRSVFKAFSFLFKSPLIFIYNAIIIFATLSICLLVKKRVFAITLVTSLWLICGIINNVVLAFRTTPFSAIDVLMLKNTIGLLDIYFDKIQIALGILLIIGIIAGMVVLYIKLPKIKDKIPWVKNITFVIGVTVAVILFTDIGVYAKGLSDNFANLAYAYSDYGFAYCFSNSIIDVGINKPDDYNEELVDKITSGLEYYDHSDSGVKNSQVTENNPNIIMIQLESFVDPIYLSDINVEGDPIPTFNSIKEKYSWGYITVPAVGAGTANTEFEVITGMSTDYFGAGEYPYKTILGKTSCESMAYDLKNYGYTSHALHNNDATFYDRDKVFANLGFDTFTAIEQMRNTHKTLAGWAEDEVLNEYIIDSLDSTVGSDYVYTITVQSHGKYPTDYTCQSGYNVTSDVLSDADISRYSYYVDQIHEVDNFIDKLISDIEKRGEPTVIVMYGDHLPGFSFDENNVNTVSLYQTEYVIWDNIGLEKQNKDLEAYQMSTYVNNRLGLEGGLMYAFHNQYEGKEEYDDYLETLEYDMLYGDHNAFNGNNIFVPTDLQLGILPLKVDGVELNSDEILVKGCGFNEFSHICINGKAIDTEYVDDSTLSGEYKELKLGDVVTVVQAGTNKVDLNSSEGYCYH